MKNTKVLLLTGLLLISFISCKEKVSEILPRVAYSQNPEGIILKTSPDVKSQMVTIIPFAEKITLTENSDKIKSETTDDKSKWYKTEWNVKSGWIPD